MTVSTGIANAAVVNSVQSGTTTSTGNGATNINITAVDPARSFLVFQSRGDDDDTADNVVRGRLNGAGTQVQFVRVTNGGGTVNIQWYVVEFTSGVSVQRGETTQSGTTVNVPITPVGSTSRAFVLHSKTFSSDDDDWNAEAPVVVALTSTSNLQIRNHQADSGHVIAWQVVEFTDSADINVQTGSTSLTGGNQQADVNLGTAVNLNTSFLLASFRSNSSGNDIGERMLRAQILNANTLRFDRNHDGDDITEIYWQVVELRDGSTVQRGSEGFNDNDGQETVGITAVDTSRALAFASVQAAGGQAMGMIEYNGSGGGGGGSGSGRLGTGLFTLGLSTNSINIQRDDDNEDADVGWFVVEFNNAGLPNAIAEWRLDEAIWNNTPGEVLDNTSNNLDGVARNGTAAEPARVCNGAHFDGTNDLIEIADNPLLDISGNLTVMAWVYPESIPGGGGLMSILSKDENYEFHIDGSGNIYWWWHNSSGTNHTLTSSGITLAPNNWYHIAITHNTAGVQRIYINGVQRASSAFAENLLTNNDPLHIGGDQNFAGREFEGFIDEVRIYSSALSSAQVTTAMNETRNCITEPLAYYSMENVTGVTVPDETGNGYNGTRVNGATGEITTPAVSGDPGTCDYGVFDGNNDYVALPTLPNLTGDFTVTAWIRADRINGDQRILADDESNGSGYAFSLGDNGSGQLRLFSRSATPVFVDSSAVITVGNWFFVAAVHDVTTHTRRLYAVGVAGNPVLVGQDTYTGTWGSDPGTASIGGETNSGGSEAVPQWRFDGFIDEMRIYDFPLTASELADVKNLTHPCDSTLGDFLISHDSFGIHCLAETITVTARDSGGSTLTGYTGTITLDTQNSNGTWSLNTGNGTLTDATANDGLATYNFVSGDNGTATFNLYYPSGPASINVDVYEGSIRDDDSEGNLAFYPNGFTVTQTALSNPPPGTIDTSIAPQTAATNFTLHIAAFGQTPTDPVCGIIESYTGAHNLNFWSTYVNPGSGTLNMSVNGAAIAVTEGASSAQAIGFTNGQASITVNYPDAGLMNLQMKDVTTGSPDLPTGIRGGSSNFVVKPAYFDISNIRRTSDGFANPAAANAAGIGFIAAGDPISLSVTARNANNNPTPNYGQETIAESVALTPNLVAPAGGNAGTFSQGTGLSTFVNGVSTATDFNWSEVGIITLTPQVGDGNYLGGGNVTGNTSVNIGRFYPHHFSTSASNGSFANTCTVATSFTYIGQGFGYLGNPSLTATAENAADATTQNYTGVWARLDATGLAWSYPTADNAQNNSAGITPIAVTSTSGTPSRTDNGNGSLTFVLGGSSADNFQYTTDRNLGQVGEFTADLTIQLSSASDGDASADDTPRSITPSGNLQRYGQAYAQDVHGTYGNAGESLVMPVAVQYLDNMNAWQLNTDDACSIYSFTSVNAGVSTTITPGSPATVANGVGNQTIQLTADTTGGTTTMNFVWDAWLGGLDSAIATFGVFRGDDRYIFWREGP